MPSWVSNGGVWTPAKEKTVVTYQNQEGETKTEIYEGDDRAAAYVLKQQGLEHLGINAKHDPQMIALARNNGMSVEEWMKLYGPNDEVLKKQEEERKKVVVTHAPNKRKKGVKPQGGSSPGPDAIEGGFGNMPKV